MPATAAVGGATTAGAATKPVAMSATMGAATGATSRIGTDAAALAPGPGSEPAAAQLQR
jgi:hypothetical protein